MPFPFAHTASSYCFVVTLAGACSVADLAGQTLSAESTAFRTAQLGRSDLRPAERLPEYLTRDFGPLWTQPDAKAVVGFSGPHYQRLEVKVLTAKRSASDPARYLLTGKTRAAGVVHSFSGTVRLEHLRLAIPRPRLGGGDDHLPAGAREGMVVGQYTFTESRGQTKAGVFRGVVATRWYVDTRNRLRYNDADLTSSDGFCNNQFVGTWTSYATSQVLRCNWGDYRAPNAGPLDIGAGEFSPNPKSLPYGWYAYAPATTTESKSAQPAQATAWWK
jgi:hypothetical protein